MAHNERCSNAREPVKNCQCDCKGALHRQEGDTREEQFRVPMSASMGGEVGEFISQYQGQQYDCLGVCHKNNVATGFLGYEHDGGLADATGKKWWIYVKCDNELPKNWGNRLCDYETGFNHLPRRIELAKRNFVEAQVEGEKQEAIQQHQEEVVT